MTKKEYFAVLVQAQGFRTEQAKLGALNLYGKDPDSAITLLEANLGVPRNAVTAAEERVFTQKAQLIQGIRTR